MAKRGQRRTGRHFKPALAAAGSHRGAGGHGVWPVDVAHARTHATGNACRSAAVGCIDGPACACSGRCASVNSGAYFSSCSGAGACNNIYPSKIGANVSDPGGQDLARRTASHPRIQGKSGDPA